MPIKLKVTDMVVGEIVFPVVEGQNLRANSTFVVNEEQFSHFTIQSAINKGFLTTVEDLKPIEEIKNKDDILGDIEDCEKNKNNENDDVCKDLNDEDRYNELNENNIKTLKSMAKDLDINRYSKLNKHSLIESIIEIEQSNKQDIKYTEEMEEAKETKETEEAKENEKGMFIDLDEMTVNTEVDDINPQKDGIINNMGAWDAYKESLLDKDASSDAVRRQHNGVEQDLQVAEDNKDVDFSAKDDQEDLNNAFDEIKKKVAYASSLPKKKNGKKITGRSKNSKFKGIKPVGEVREEASPDDAFVIEGPASDVDFVDMEQRNEAIRNHPVLGKKKEGNS